MIPILYEKNERSFINNGLCRLHDMVSCEVTEERNGVYECNFVYPVDGANYEKIQCGRIIGVIHDDTKTIQPFDIVSYTRPINGLVTFHCVHISYRLTGYTMKASNVSNIQEAIVALIQAGTPFNFDYEVMRFGYMSAANGIPLSVRQFIGGVQGSMLDTYGGEIIWDKFNVTFTKNRGRLTDFKIRYGLNMVNYEEEADFLGTYNQCLPYWTDGTNTIYGDVVSSGFNTYTGRDICMPLDLSDKFETAPTKADLEAKALSYMQNNQTHLPRQNIKVDFVRLQDTGEYEQFESLLECNLCDSIGVIFPRYGMQGTFKIVRVVYDVLAERYKEMELGALSVSLAEALGISSNSQSLASNNPEDYIVEEGTSGIWTYRKYASGIAECWGRTPDLVKTFNITLGQGYRTDKFTATYPTGLFISPPVTNLTLHDNGAILGWVSLSANSATVVEGYPSALISVTNKTIHIDINAKGRWK